MATTMDPELGRRERKKRAVRDALVDAALDLFDEQGVDATTVEQISERADVAARTFHRHFASKLDVLFADTAERDAAFADALAARPDDEPILVSLRESLLALTDLLSATREREIRRSRIIESHDGLRAMSIGRSEAWVASIAEVTAERLGARPDDLLPLLLGGCAVATVRAARVRWLAGRCPDLSAGFAEAFAMLTSLDHAIGAQRSGRR